MKHSQNLDGYRRRPVQTNDIHRVSRETSRLSPVLEKYQTRPRLLCGLLSNRLDKFRSLAFLLAYGFRYHAVLVENCRAAGNAFRPYNYAVFILNADLEVVSPHGMQFHT